MSYQDRSRSAFNGEVLAFSSGDFEATGSRNSTFRSLKAHWTSPSKDLQKRKLDSFPRLPFLLAFASHSEDASPHGVGQELQ